MSKATE